MKEIQLLGDYLGEAGYSPQSGWVLTSQGVKYKVGPKDSLPLLAKRYLGDWRAENHILAMQTNDVQKRGIKTGDILNMPTAAIEHAHALGLVRGLSGFAGQADVPLTRQTGMGGLAAGHEPGGYYYLPPSPSESPQPTARRADLGAFSDTLDAYTAGHQLQESINVTVETVMASVQQDQTTSKKIDADTYSAWDAFHRGWADFRSHEPSPAWLVVETVPYLNTLNNRYQDMKANWWPTATGWAQRIKSITGGLVGPVAPPPPTPAPGDSGDTGSSVVKWVAIAAIVGGAAYALGPILRRMGKR